MPYFIFSCKLVGRPSQSIEGLESPSSVEDAQVNFSHVIMFILHRIRKMQSPGCWAENKMRPPIFSALGGMRQNLCYNYLAIALVATIFGGIHCVGWRFAFPSYTEKILWRVASLITSVIPCIISIPIIASSYALRAHVRFPPSQRRLNARNIGVKVWFLVIKFIPIYLLARVILLVEAFITLRNLPQGAYVQVEWLKFIPHI